jgi:hypothetical protein
VNRSQRTNRERARARSRQRRADDYIARIKRERREEMARRPLSSHGLPRGPLFGGGQGRSPQENQAHADAMLAGLGWLAVIAAAVALLTYAGFI